LIGWSYKKYLSISGNRRFSKKNYFNKASVVNVAWNDTLAIRTRPTTSARRIGDIPPSTKDVYIIKRAKRWYKVNYHGIIGWSYGKYLRIYQ
jgi:hypothetical protein